MWKKKTIISILLGINICAMFGQMKVTSYVNPIIGTNGMGHTFPGACVPFGLVQLSPDTDTIPHNVDGRYQQNAYEYCAGYQYRDHTIVGFSHTHLSGTGHSDLGDILIMPVTGELKFNPGTAGQPDSGYRSRFSHDTEKCTPGYYEVVLDDYKVKAQLTATQRVGIHKYTFPEAEGRVLIDLTHGIYNYDGKTLWSTLRVENDTLLTGYRITNGWARTNYTYFAISFSRPIKKYGSKERGRNPYNGFWGKLRTEQDFPDMAGRRLAAYFDFDLPAGKTLELKVALSGVSAEGAIRNLQAETAGKNFDELCRDAADSWKKHLNTIEAQGTPDQLAMIYTSYYHTLINPSVYMDVDGKYRGSDQRIHQANGFDNYTIFSLWDTYRAEHPFLNLMKPSENRNMVESMMKHQEQNVLHLLPMWSLMGNEGWCMSGYHAAPVLADAIVKGALIDKREALDAMVASATSCWMEGMTDYMRLGYVPLDHCGIAASNTLEYAYDDFTVYQVALLAGDQETAALFKQRALNYRHLYDPESGLARPRYADGTFRKDFNPLQTHGEGFIEGNSMNFSFHAPHDVFGLIQCMGGEEKFTNRLDELFTMHLPEEYYEKNEDITEEGLLGGYVHGNEPSHHIPYLYAWTSQPWKTQYWVREIMNRMYKNNINGLSGNDDCGQMSAWYLFTAMGFYPVCPGTDEYVLGAPYVPYMKLVLPNGKIFEMKAPGVSDKKRYVKQVKLNGKVVDKLFIRHQDIVKGGILEFVMSASPNKKRGQQKTDKPYSLTY